MGVALKSTTKPLDVTTIKAQVVKIIITATETNKVLNTPRYAVNEKNICRNEGGLAYLHRDAVKYIQSILWLKNK